MKTLYLLRHAKSSWDEPSLADRDRPLAPRGCRAATLIGQHLARFDARPELVLCSPARRSAETLERLLEALGPTAAPRVETREELYLGGQRTLLDAVRELPTDTSRVLLIAHNPDLHELAVSLSGSGEPGPLAALKERFPTGALAVLGLSDWAEANAGVGRLKEFVRPRDLS